MSPAFKLFSFAFFLVSLVSQAWADCASYGVDFQNGGSYFINSNDNSSFTCVSTFVGCTGTADVILVDPNSNSYECTPIATQPDDALEISTWSVGQIHTAQGNS